MTDTETEREASHAPVWYGADEACAWAAGYNAAIEAFRVAGLAPTPTAIMRKALEEICAGPLNTGAVYRRLATGALDQIAASPDTSTVRNTAAAEMHAMGRTKAGNDIGGL